MTERDFTKDNDGSTVSMVVASATKFQIAGPMRIERINIPIFDATGGGTWNTLGAITKLSNGIVIDHLNADGSVKENFGTIKQNLDWCLLAGRDGWEPTSGATGYCVRWSSFKYRNGIILKEGEKMQIWVKDATTGIDYLQARAQGSVPL